ncbi:protein kinase domain-containing protein [Streptomyces olivaceoviridis]
MAQETQPGKVIGDRFRLDEALARGGFGIVWQARDLDLGIDVAVKELYLPPATSPKEHADRLARAEREPRNAARLRDHPHVVAVHDVVFDDDKPWMIMRLVTGHSLLEHLDRRGPLSVAEATRAARHLLSALQAAHREEIIHRDVKPANVMVADNGDFLLTDFGIAVHATDTSLTTTGGFIGSLEYVAPERANGVDDRPVSDLFSLGATLYQAVEGVSPFRRDSQTATLTAILIEQPDPPRHAGTLTPLITALLEKDPDERPTVEKALALLDAPPTKGAGGTTRTKVTGGGGRTKEAGTGGTSERTSRFDATPAARERAALKGVDLARVKGTGKGGQITVQDVYAAERTTSGHQASAWLFVAVLAVLALVFGPKIIDAATKDDTSTTGSQPASTYTPYAPPAAESHDVSDPATEEAEPDPAPDPACRVATDTLQSHIDLIPNPVTSDNVDSAVTTYQDLASSLDRAASDADDPDVHAAVSALAADARTMGASLRDPGNSSFHAARDEMSSDLEDLSSACEGSSKS